ncbi:heterocyst development glycosyltransferase HepC [Brasilonema sp. UFV-L1]|uniref:heterocyst development glycosyltransferase HepC n=1 Tax=Brasilonema sp. UFV-L1 TaxID=2234130 RepID=UPI00145EB1FE|nr:heterocyst development glycosyltransferase HepC [Brasilonema sp. UFV-L1]NMG06936.1 sugar transferase [Brasilonema sp. UFV-L1]
MTTTPRIPALQNYYSVKQQQDNPSQYCTLQWRQGQLLVRPIGVIKQPYMPSLDRKESLVECLKHSPTNLVRIDPKLGEARLKFWADACEKANKPIFLRIPSSEKHSKSVDSVLWWLKRLTDWLTALIFLLAVSPIMLGLILLMRVSSPKENSLFSSQWCVGERGRLFKVFKFRTTKVTKKAIVDQAMLPLGVSQKAIAYQDTLCDGQKSQNLTTLGRWMRKYGLDNLPQLLNVLRGEMSLTGPRCWTLEDAVRLSPEAQRQLNRLPGIVRSWEVEAESKLLHLDSQIL